MLRRKLTAYTMMYIAGITAGYFMSEQVRPVLAFGLLASVLLAILFADLGLHNDNSTKAVMTAFMMMGFMIFTLRFAAYGSEVSALAGSEGRMRARVISADIKDDRLKMTVRKEDEPCRGMKMQLTLTHYSRHPLYDESGSETDMPVYDLSGAVITASGEFRETMPADDPGCFDNRTYLRAKGICLYFKAYGVDIEDSSADSAGSIRRRLYKSREDFLNYFDEDISGFIRGVIFGDKSEIDEDTVREFNFNSTGHILAVSGLHVGFLYAMLRMLTGRRRTKSASLCVILAIVTYGEMTMWSPATIRACIVLSVSVMAVHFRRPFDLLTSVSLAALIILIYQPYQLFDPGFRMSFLAMSGIAFFSKPLSTAFGEALGVMMAVQLGTMPLAAYSFCRVNPLAMFINIPVILLSSVLVPLCLMMLISVMISGAAPLCGIRLADLISYSILRINHLMSLGGGFSYKTAGAGALTVLVIYTAAFTASSEWVRICLIRKQKSEIVRNLLFLILPLVMMSAGLYDRFADDEIVFVSVGQGDCVHIRADGHDMLIDGGGRDDYNTGERILMPYLLHGGADRVEMALVTHLHMDHFRGICELSQEYPIGAVGIPGDYRGNHINYKDSDGDTIEIPQDRIRYIMPDSAVELTDDVRVEVIWPVEMRDEAISLDDPNEHNTVYMIHYGSISVMVTGDLLESDEADMLQYYDGTDALRCDILKIAHHGSRSSSSEAFLDAASPRAAVIQVGRDNFYGHPHEQTLRRLAERGIPVYRTDINGAVGIDIGRSGFSVDLYRRPPDRSRLKHGL